MAFVSGENVIPFRKPKKQCPIIPLGGNPGMNTALPHEVSLLSAAGNA